MEPTLFTDLTLVILIASAIALIMSLLRQPLILGYIITGIIVGPAVLSLISNGPAFASLSQIGITLLLFIIGLGMNPGVIKSLGKPVVLTAASILIMVGVAGFITSELLGLTVTEGVIIGLGLFFSSTIIILKVISDKKETSRLYAQLAVGVIVVDDIVATIGLLAIAAISGAGSLNGVQDPTVLSYAWLALKAIGLLLILVIVATQIIPRIGSLLARSQELLFLFGIAWGLGVASLFDTMGLSYEIGALAAGICLSTLPYAIQMSTRLKPLRDFFIVLFFIHLGETFDFGQLGQSLIPALLLSTLVIVGKPLAVMAVLSRLGYTRLTSFKAGIHLSQISEFSMVLVIFAYTSGMASQHTVSIITLVALISIGISTYLMKYDDSLYGLMNSWLHKAEHQSHREVAAATTPPQAILLGYSRGASEFINTFRQLKQKYLVVEYNPDKIDKLQRQGIRHIYGDATDIELLEEIGAPQAKIIISTIADTAANQIVADFLQQQKSTTQFICPAEDLDQAESLYQQGAAFVILPNHLNAQALGRYLQKSGLSHKSISTYRQRHRHGSSPASSKTRKPLLGY